ncbi:MAG TPA: hypothetical protein VMX18_01795 [Candidatus Bipolaricaulota bacterium]|nr:hypothetical protein [Candidatus Bipolaricaulota bacterium]
MPFFVNNGKQKQPPMAVSGKKEVIADSKSPRQQVDSRLQFGYWWVGNKSTVKNIALIFFLTVAGAFLLYGMWGVLDYYVLSHSANKRLYQPRAVSLNWNYIDQISTPSGIEIDDVKVLKAKDNYDLLSKVSNLNDNWYVRELRYHFVFGNENTETKTAFVLPGSVTYIAELNQSRPASGLAAELVIDSLKWKKEPNFQLLQDELLRFDVTDVEYVPSGQSGIEGSQPINQVKFKIKNSSPQNYWDVDLIILLYGGTQLRAINTFHLDSLDSLEQRDITINWPGILPAVNKVSVIPQLDILNPDSFKGFKEIIGEQK